MTTLPQPSLEGYSVLKDDTPRGLVYRVYRDNIYVASISPLYNGKLAFEWHDRHMWKYRVEDFVLYTAKN